MEYNRRNFPQIFCFLLLLLVLFVSCNKISDAFQTEIISYNNISETFQSEITFEQTDLEKVLYKGLLNRETRIDISGFGFTKNDGFPNPHEFTYQFPELDYDNKLDFTTYSENGIGLYIEVTYPANADEISKKLNDTVADAVSTIKNNLRSDSSDAERVCAISDYIVTHSRYAYKADGVTPDDNYASAYSVLVEGRGICEAYADAFNILSRKFNLQSITVSGSVQTNNSSSSHAWNLVKIEDDWYHVDITWNDPTPDEEGRAYHGYLLLSDAAMKGVRGSGDNIHVNWTAPWLDFIGKQLPACNSNDYEDAFWVYHEVPISFAKLSFAEQNTNFNNQTLSDVFKIAYESGNKVIVRQFGLSSDEIWELWNRVYPDKQLVVLTSQGEDKVHAIQLNEYYTRN